MHTTSRLPGLALTLVAVAACRHTTANSAPDPRLLAGEWALAELAGQPAPAGAGGRFATLAFNADSSRVSGFAGCNRLSAGYTVAGDSLRFGPAAMTRMACADGMELERRVADALGATVRFQVSGASLTLLGRSGPLARFTKPTER